MRFRARIEAAGKTAAGFEVSPQIVDGLGAGRRPPVRVTINGHTYRTSIGSMGGRYLASVSAEHRAAAGVKAGQEVDIDLQLDTEPREVVLPQDFATALNRVPTTRAFFDGLSYSERRWFVLGIEGAKTDETRRRRIASAVDRLGSGRGQR
ncbi:MAG: YdeI/OmpD-associated family protein [Gemmatimonadales bacterium]